MSEEPEETTPLESEMPEAYTSPLRILLSEMHEVYQELIIVGFEDRIATMVIAHMIQDAMLYRGVDEDTDDENDELDDESDNNDDRGTK